jgi:ubiquinone/menaquinone biosynthesis C-methylase UbiE
MKVEETLTTQKIEILSVEMLDNNRPIVDELIKLASCLHLEFGWHYLLDLTWTIQNLGIIQGKQIMDAGAGTGILQWYLADAGAEVTSVDRLSRAVLPPRFRRRYHVQGLRATDLSSTAEAFFQILNRPVSGPFYRRWAARLVALGREIAGYFFTTMSIGKVLIYNQDLTNLTEIQDNALDAIVAISSLEHNTPEVLEEVVAELMRVLKPGGVLLATLTAGRDRDWWHTASSGWCYTDISLRKIFKLPIETPSNYTQYDELFNKLKICAELRDNLARFYYQSSDKGMPHGVWNPEYQPVGVCKIKSFPPDL